MRLSSNRCSHIITKRYGLKRCVCFVSLYAVYLLILLVQCDIATALILLSAWIRYAGTSRSLSKGGAYSLIIIGQVGKIRTPYPSHSSCFLQALSAISQPVYQILAPKYSERWFDLKGRTTATMIISIGTDAFRGMKFPQLTRARLSESSRWWVRSATVTHIFGYPQVGTCTFSYLQR